jgi:hypothetical protein
LSVRYVDRNGIIFADRKSGVTHSEISLGIILRNNSSRNALSAAVEDYELFIGTKGEIDDVE